MTKEINNSGAVRVLTALIVILSIHAALPCSALSQRTLPSAQSIDLQQLQKAQALAAKIEKLIDHPQGKPERLGKDQGQVQGAAGTKKMSGGAENDRLMILTFAFAILSVISLLIWYLLAGRNKLPGKTISPTGEGSATPPESETEIHLPVPPFEAEKISIDYGGSGIADEAATQKLYEACLGDKNRFYYLKRFEKFDRKGLGLKASWNWSAFLYSGFWAFYRKMYGWVFAICGLVLFSAILEKSSTNSGSLLVHFFVSVITAVPMGLFALYATSLYHESIKKKIAIAQLVIKEESKLIEHLRHTGGVNTWMIWVVWLAPVFGIIIAFGIFMAVRN